MIGFRPGIARCRRLPGRVSSLAVATGLLVAACGPAHTAATGAATAHGTVKPSSSGSPPPRSTADCASVATCYTPQQLEVAYGVQPLLKRGIDGRGETVVLPELAETQLNPPQVTDLRRDFAAYDRLFRLPAPRLKVVSTFPGSAHPWLAFGEEVLDAEVVHAIAPRAALTIVLVKGTSLDSAGQAVAASVAALRLGASEGGIISLSPAGQIGGEHCVDDAQLTQLNAALQADAGHHVTVVAATGDIGAAGEPCALIDALGGSMRGFTPRKEVGLVASDPLVLSAGGTTLHASHPAGAWIGETAWGLPDGSPGSPFQASGGGFSHLFRRPSYQTGVQGIGSMRGVPDVAADGDAVTGIAVITGNAGGGYTISGHAGTSASAPLWAGIITLADQYAQRHLGFVNPAIYQIARGPRYHQAFHDVTAGNSNTAEFPPTTITGYRAGPGWDPVTGWGSPDAQVLVPLLARYATGGAQ
jgi:subtilase family serine protease